MRKILFLALAMTVLISSKPSAAADSPLKEAATQYQAGDYQKATASYEKLILSGSKTGALYYNLGNAAFRAGQKGKAILAYERALSLEPRDADIRWNLGVIKNTVVDIVDDPDGNILISGIKQLLRWVTIDEVAAVFAAALGLLFLFSLSMVLAPSWRAGLRTISMAWVVLAILAGTVFLAKWLDVKDSRAVVLTKEVLARYGPSEKETKAFSLHEGAEVKIVDETQDWYLISFGSKNTAWIKKSSCELI